MGARCADGAIVDIAGDEKKVDLLREAQIDKVIERFVARFLHTGSDGLVARLEANDRAVDVQISGVNELEGLQRQLTEETWLALRRSQGALSSVGGMCRF